MRELILDRYRLVRDTGPGHEIETWEAEDTGTRRKVTINRIDRNIFRHRIGSLIHFQKDISTLLKSRHAGLTSLLEFREVGNEFIFVYEAAEGIDARELLQKSGPLSLPLALDIIIAAADALAFLHARNICHLALTPDNIVIRMKRKQNQVKISGAGISRLQRFNPDMKSESLRRFTYMPPEQSGILARSVGQRSDLYSLGIIFYELLTGCPPYTAEGIYTLIHKHLAMVPEPVTKARPDVPGILERIIETLLEKDINLRYAGADLLARDLRKVKESFQSGAAEPDFIPGFSLKTIPLEHGLKMIGREREIETLKWRYWDATQGKSGLVFIKGDSGAGKTRLMEEFERFIVLNGGICLNGVFRVNDIPEPYSGITQILEDFFSLFSLQDDEWKQKVKSDVKEQTGDLLHSLVSIIPGIAVLTDGPVLHQSIRLNDRGVIENLLLSLLAGIARQHAALVICIDNIQWMDQTSLGFIKNLGKSGIPLNILGICSVRSEAVEAYARGPGFKDLFDTGEVLDIQNLGHDEVASFLRNSLGTDSLPFFSELTEILWQKTAGNPFFIIRFFNTLVEEGLITYTEKWDIDLSTIRNLPFSDNVVSLVLNNIDLMDPETKHVLSLFSLWGKDVNLDEFILMFPEFNDQAIYKAIEDGINAKLLLTSGNHVYFCHDIVCEVFYQYIDRDQKEVLHGKIAALLESLASGDSQIYRIEYHYGKSGNFPKQAEYLKKCAELSFRTGSFNDALEYFRKFISYLETNTGSSHGDFDRAYSRLGDTYMAIGLYNEAIASFRKVLEFRSNPAIRSEALQRISHCLQSVGRYKDAIEMISDALALLGDFVPRRKIGTGIRTIAELISLVKNRRSIETGGMRVSERDSVIFRRLKLYHELGLVCIWAMRQDLLIYSHFKAMNLIEGAGVSEESIILLLTHCAMLGSLGMPGPVILKLYKRIGRVLKRVERELTLLDFPHVPYALYLGVRGSVYLDDASVADAKKALAVLNEKNSIGMLQEISNCCVQIFEHFGEFAEIDALAKDLKNKSLIFNNSQLMSLHFLYAGIFDYYSGNLVSAESNLNNALRGFLEVNDGVNAQYTRLFLLRTFSRLGDHNTAFATAELCMKTIRKTRQVHQMVISRVYPFLLEEVLTTMWKSPAPGISSTNLRAVSRKLVGKCRSLVKVYPFYAGCFSRLHALFVLNVSGNNREAAEILAKGLRYYDNVKSPYDRGVHNMCYGRVLADFSPKDAVTVLEDALVDLESCGAGYEIQMTKRILNDILKKTAGNGRADETAIMETDSFTAVRELNTLLEITRQIGTIKETDELYRRVVLHAVELVGAEYGEIFLYENERLTSGFRAIPSGGSEQTAPAAVIERVRTTRESVVLENAQADGAFQGNPDIIKHLLRSILCVPVMYQGNLQGVLYLGNRNVSGAFSTHEADLIDALAGQAAVAIRNSLLFRETERLHGYLYSILESIPNALIAIDSHGIINHCNSQTAVLFRDTGGDLIGKKLMDVFPEFTRYLGDIDRVIAARTVIEHSREIFNKHTYRIMLFPLMDETGSGAVIKVEDITEKTRLQEQLLQAQKMEAIGTLIGGIAHDFNNILSGILATVSYQSEYTLNSKDTFVRSDFEEDFNTIKKSVNRAAGLVTQLMSLTAKKENLLEPVSLNAAVRNVADMCKKTFDKSIVIKLNLPDPPAVILADPAQIEQVLLNLYINSAHAMTIMHKPDEKWGGVISVKVEKRTVRRDKKNHDKQDGTPYWCLTVEDSGVGMSESVKSKIFEPFFTTKDPGKGTGLGLAMVYNIVTGLDGFLDVFSEEGKGSLVSIFFPCGQGTVLPGQTDEKASLEHRGSGYVLIIDDEDIIQTAIRRFLNIAGYDVISAGDGEKGLAMFREAKESIKAVILDMVLPKQPGMEVFASLRRIDPSIGVILTSGFDRDERIDELLKRRPVVFLRKPFTHIELFNAIERLEKQKS